MIIVPLLPSRFTVALNSPLPPGGMVHGVGGNSGWVQPHDAWAPKIVTLTGVKFVIAVMLVEVVKSAVVLTLVASKMSMRFATFVKLKLNRTKS